MLFLTAISSIYSTYYAYKDWKDNPTITTVNTTAYPIKSIEFPAITICSQGASKDVMDVVLLRQFEAFLKSKRITAKPKQTGNSTTAKPPKQTGNPTIQRRKRSIEPNIAYTLSKAEVGKIYLGSLTFLMT